MLETRNRFLTGLWFGLGFFVALLILSLAAGFFTGLAILELPNR